jgi:hypothetical protein
MEQTAAETAWLEFSEKLHQVAFTMLSEPEIPIGPKGSADPKVIATLLLIRTVSNFKGAITLAREGMIVETRTLTRCCVENLIWLARLVAEGDGFVKEMGFDEAESMQKRTKFILEKNLSDETTRAKMKVTWDKFVTQLPKAKIKLLSPKSVTKGGVLENYYLVYSQLSADAAHPSLTALARYLVPKDAEGVRGIAVCPLPRHEEMASTVHHAWLALMGACIAFNQIVPTQAGHALAPLLVAYDILKAETGIV